MRPSRHALRLIIISDTHNHTAFEVPNGDLLLHCGDFTMDGSVEEIAAFDRWLGSLPHPQKVVIAGNHEKAFERTPRAAHASLKNAHYLQDTAITIGNVLVYGSPWQPWFYDWAFNLPRGEALAAKWAQIPSGVDVLVTHGPPRGILDRTLRGEEVGCDDLRKAVERVSPLVHAFGHIHSGAGAVRRGRTLFVNASICDEYYRPRQSAVVVDIAKHSARLVVK